jgi:hypothetical protein
MNNYSFILKSGISLMLSIFLFACSSTIRTTTEVPVYITNSRAIYPLPPSDIKTPLDEAQLLEGTYGNQSFSLESWTIANDSLISISLFNSIGASFGSLFYSKDSIFFNSSFIKSKQIKPQYIVTDFQLCFYKTEPLQKMYSKHGLLFFEKIQKDTIIRGVIDQKDTIIKITRNPEMTLFKNHLRNYEYRIHHIKENK